jgi:hypothetical protein
MRRLFLFAAAVGILAAALMGLAAAPVTQFSRGGSASGQLVIATNGIVALGKTSTALVDVSGWFGTATLTFSGVYPSAVTNDVIVTVDVSFDSNVWKNAWLVWTNRITGTTTNRTQTTLNLDGIGYVRASITNTAPTLCQAVSLWARYSAKRF